MTSWTHGYVADSPYTFSYQGAQAPGNLALICGLMGVQWQPTASLAFADIGCGRGYTVNALAAANQGWNVIGLDYNPAHIAEATAIAEQAQLPNASFMEADLAAMTDAEIDRLPELDVASLHGVWTWVSDEVRAGIVRLLSRRLKPGGLLYIGYNVLPGFGHDQGLQRLFRMLAAQQSTGSSPMRIEAAVATVRKLHETRPANLPATAMLKRIADGPALDPDYLAHEFLTEHWRPVFFADLCADLGAAKLDYVGSATLHENVADFLFTPEQREIYDSMPDGAPREFIKDLCVARSFRRDVFVRGMRRIDPVGAQDRLRLTAYRKLDGEEVPALEVPVGKAELPIEMWRPIAAALNAGSRTVGELRNLPEGRKPNGSELLVLLMGAGLVLPALRDPGTTEASRRFNEVVAAAYAGFGGQSQFAIASPVTAAGVPASWLELAVSQTPEGRGEVPADHAALAARLMPGLDPETLDKVSGFIGDMLTERAPIWRTLGIV